MLTPSTPAADSVVRLPANTSVKPIQMVMCGLISYPASPERVAELLEIEDICGAKYFGHLSWISIIVGMYFAGPSGRKSFVQLMGSFLDQCACNGQHDPLDLTASASLRGFVRVDGLQGFMASIAFPTRLLSTSRTSPST